MNALEEEERGTNVLRLSMKRLYKMLEQTGYLKTPIKKQAIEHKGEYCEYHQHIGHHINYCKVFRVKVEDMMTLGVLRVGALEENLVGTMTGFDKKVEVCRYQSTEGGPPKLFWLYLQAQLVGIIMPYLIIMVILFIPQDRLLLFMLKLRG